MTPTAAAAKTLRAALKKSLGVTARQVSVRTHNYSLGSSLLVEIKDPAVEIAAVEKIASEFESVRRCEITGDVLCGGNRHLMVSYSDEARSARSAPYLDACRDAMTALDEPTRCLHSIAGTELLLGHGPSGHFLSIGAQTIYVRTPEIAARYVAELLAEQAARDAELEEGNAYPALRLVS